MLKKIIFILVLLIVASLLILRQRVLIPSKPQPVPTTYQVKTSTYYYPINDYQNRLKLRWFEKYLTQADKNSVVCGYPFTGFHTGDDLETFSNEANIDVPVYSIAGGTVISVSTISGYGGLIVVRYNLSDQEVTAYYGHVNLQTVLVANNEKVIAGQKLGFLGMGCSSQTNNERKHLHFAIHFGNTVDIRGYVMNQSELLNWLNPSEELKNLMAQNPNN